RGRARSQAPEARGGARDGHAPATLGERRRGARARGADVSPAIPVESLGPAYTPPIVSGTTAIGQSATATRSKRPFGVRLYLTLGFAAVALIAAGFSYVLLTGSSDQAASSRAADITVGHTVRLADRIGTHPLFHASSQLDSVSDSGYSAWVFNAHRQLLTPARSHDDALSEVTDRPQ